MTVAMIDDVSGSELDVMDWLLQIADKTRRGRRPSKHRARGVRGPNLR